jgi:hypothetical protein
MLLRPPSLQKHYDAFYWRDPAFIQPPEDGEDLEKAREAHSQRMKTARETGSWTDVSIEGKQPTKFVMRPLPGTIGRRLSDKLVSGALGYAELYALAFRASIVSIENLGSDYKIKLVAHEWLGDIASEEVVNMLDALELGIVNDLGSDAYERAKRPSGK